MTSENARKLLYRAAEEIERRGWCRGKFSNKHGNVCLRAAVLAADVPDPTEDGLDADRKLNAYTMSASGLPASHHNDLVLENGEQAAAVLRAAADHEEVAP